MVKDLNNSVTIVACEGNMVKDLIKQHIYQLPGGEGNIISGCLQRWHGLV